MCQQSQGNPTSDRTVQEHVIVASGSRHAVMLSPTGEIRCEGPAEMDYWKAPPNLPLATAIASGHEHIVALLADGTVRCWGSGNYGNSSVGHELHDITAIAAGDYHSIALRGDGSIACWGYKHSIPTNDVIRELPAIRDIAASGGATFVRDKDGRTWAWGASTIRAPWNLTAPELHAYLGSNADAMTKGDMIAQQMRRQRLIPVAKQKWMDIQPTSVPVAKAFIELWGTSLGADLCSILREIPASVIKGFAAGEEHGIVCFDDGKCATWGKKNCGKVPRDARGVKEVSAGAGWCAARDNAGKSWIWGAACQALPWVPSNIEELILSSGQRGALAPEFSGWLQSTYADSGLQAAGNATDAIVLLPSGNLTAWGKNWSPRDRKELTKIGPGHAVAAGNSWLAAQMRNGKTFVWGKECDQLPWDNDCTTEFAAEIHERRISDTYWQKIFGATRTPAICPGGIEVDLSPTGRVRCVGENVYGRCNVPAGLSAVAKVAVGNHHVIALLRDGTVRCWGYNSYGQCKVPAGLVDVVDVIGGRNHSIAKLKDGSIRCWGGTDPAVSRMPTGIVSPVSKLQIGDRLTWCLDANGDAHVWGVLSDIRDFPFDLSEDCLLRFAARYGEHVPLFSLPEKLRKHPQFKAMRALWRMRKGT